MGASYPEAPRPQGRHLAPLRLTVLARRGTAQVQARHGVASPGKVASTTASRTQRGRRSRSCQSGIMSRSVAHDAT